jgi:hypothetical protein
VISTKFARRTLLAGLGGSAALSLPLLRSLEARAAGGKAPLRFLVISHPLGCTNLNQWVPATTTTTTTFTLPFESAPFAPLQKYMCMIDGLNIVTAGGGNDPSGGPNTHEGGMVALMTGVPTVGIAGQQDRCAGGPSIDQMLLQQSPVLGGVSVPSPTPFGSLQLAADVRSNENEVAPRVMSYLAPLQDASLPTNARQPLYPEDLPLDTYNRIFGGSVAQAASAAQTLAKTQGLTAYLLANLNRMQSRVPASEKGRLNAHAQAIAQLEGSLQQPSAPDGGIPSANSVCATPAAPPAFPPTNTDADAGYVTSLPGVDYYVPNEPTSHPFLDLGLAQLRLIKAAFLCDLARVATFLWTPATDWVVFPGTFQGATLPGNPLSSPHIVPSQSTDPATLAWLSQINNFFSASTAQILQEFATTPDIDGNMLLDNTVVVYVTDVTRASDNNQQNVPVIVFGGKNTGVNGGTVLKVSGGPLPTLSGLSTGNRPMNDLWLALAPIFGVNMTSLGAQTGGTSGSLKNAPQYTGPLPGVIT